MPAAVFYKEVVVEVEQCVDCRDHQSCTRHHVEKRDGKDFTTYDKKREMLAKLLDQKTRLGSDIVKNPGPKSRGMHCRQPVFPGGTAVINKAMWESLQQDPNTRKWFRDTLFRYPRLGAFEVTVCKGHQRVEVYSKLKTRKWPNVEWVVDQINNAIDKVGGYEPAVEEVKKAKQYRGVTLNGEQKMTLTDEELRTIVSKKFKQITAAFRAFDKDGDGQVNKSEFMIGMKEAQVDLPPQIMNQLWRMADEDNSGSLNYQEFVRKFTNIKHSHSLHRHANLQSAADVKMEQLHGVGAGSRMARSTVQRQSENVTFKMEESQFTRGPIEDEEPTTIAALSRTKAVQQLGVEECTPDQLRAKMYVKHGNLMTAFRQLDNSGDSRICFDEFRAGVHKCLGEPLSYDKCIEFWQALDVDMTGEIDMSEFSNGACSSHKKTMQGVAIFKDMAVDVAAGQRPDHLKERNPLFGVEGTQQSRRGSGPNGAHAKSKDSKDMKPSESASTIATAASPEPGQTAK